MVFVRLFESIQTRYTSSQLGIWAPWALKLILVWPRMTMSLIWLDRSVWTDATSRFFLKCWALFQSFHQLPIFAEVVLVQCCVVFTSVTACGSWLAKMRRLGCIHGRILYFKQNQTPKELFVIAVNYTCHRTMSYFFDKCLSGATKWRRKWGRTTAINNTWISIMKS